MLSSNWANQFVGRCHVLLSRQHGRNPHTEQTNCRTYWLIPMHHRSQLASISRVTHALLKDQLMNSNWKNFCRTGVWLFVCLLPTSQSFADLSNGSFEEPNTGPLPTGRFISQDLVPNWQTNATSGFIEIWSNGFNGVDAYEGNQHAELNADQASTLFQDVSGIDSGLIVGFEFAHRARVGTDVMRLTITDLGADNMQGGGNDSVLFSKEYSATTLQWEFNTSSAEAPIMALGNNVRFAYEAISTGSGNLTQGNFIDAANFGVGIAIPEPSAGTFLIGLAWLTLMPRRRNSRTRLFRGVV